MTDRPISFNGPMMQALLDGRKTQTRRVLKPQPRQADSGEWYLATPAGFQYLSDPHLMLPYAPGDRLWVKEAWRSCITLDGLSPSQMGDRAIEAGYKRPWGPVLYEADGHVSNWTDNDGFSDTVGRYRHARFMPRWASRATLTVTGVRVQRLQEISEDDARAEGIEWCSPPPRGLSGWRDYSGKPGDMTRRYFGDARRSFETLWNSIYGPAAWDANPWVCAVTFTVERRNIDAAGD